MSEIEELRIAVEANEKDIDDLEKTVQALSDICQGSKGAGEVDEEQNSEFEEILADDEDAVDANNASEKSFSFQEMDGGVEILGYNGPRVATLVIPNEINNKPVISIGNEAFIELKIQKVVLPKTCKEIKDRAFNSCTLESIEFPDALISLGKSVFSDCKNLKAVEFNPNLRNIGEYCFWRSGIQSLDLPPYVKAVPNGCFEWCRSLKSVSLNENLEMLGSSAFYDTAIQKIALPENIRLVEKSALDFSTQRKSKIAVLGVDTKFEELPSNAEIYCLPGSVVFQQAQESGMDVKTLSEYMGSAFIEEEKRINALGDTIETLNSIFDSVQLNDEIEKYKRIAKIASLINCTAVRFNINTEKQNKNLQKAESKKKIIDAKVEEAIALIKNDINDASKCIFSYRKVEGGIKVIGYKGVKHGTLIIPDRIDGRPVVSIGKCAFERMYFKKMILPQFCTVVEAEAFCFCLKLQEIELPEALIRLGECAFYGCRQLTKVIFPPNIREIQMGCFSNCSRLEAVILNDGIEIIEESAFKRTLLKKVILPESVKLVKGHQESPEVHFPLKDDTFPFDERTIIAVAGAKTKFENIPRNVIIYCSPESSVQKQAQALGVKVYPLDDLSREFAYREIDGEIEILGCNNPQIKTLIIPETIKDKTVVGIGACAFKKLPIVKAVIPSTIKYIESGAFIKCENLKTVDISYGIERLGDSVFLGCQYLEHISLPNSLLELGREDFKSTGLVNIVIPEKVKRIPRRCFLRCHHLKSVTLNDGLTEISEGAFRETALNEIIIPESVNAISGDAFYLYFGRSLKAIFFGAKTEFDVTRGDFNGLIYCLPGSKVEEQARQSGLEVRPLSEFESQ